MSSPRHQCELRLPPQAAGRRLDQALADAMPAYSRSRLKRWIDAGQLKVDGRVPRPRDIVAGGERIVLDAPAEDAVTSAAQAIPLDIAWEDADVIVVNKPAGLVVHPGAGNPDQTLQNALLAFDPKLSKLPRAGIVHRLDKDTTGLLIVARNDAARDLLTAALTRARDPSRVPGGLRRRDDLGRHGGCADRSPPGRSPAHVGALERPRRRDALPRHRALPPPHLGARDAGDRPHAPDPPAPGARRLPAGR